MKSQSLCLPKYCSYLGTYIIAFASERTPLRRFANRSMGTRPIHVEKSRNRVHPSTSIVGRYFAQFIAGIVKQTLDFYFRRNKHPRVER